MKGNETFEDIVQAMTAKEIIMAMVNGLKNPAVNIDMGTFGSTAQNPLNKKKPICFGCAATNTICHIAGVTFGPRIIVDTKKRAAKAKCNFHFLREFEQAIDYLRAGNLWGYNAKADFLDIAKIEEQSFHLPILQNNFDAEDLEEYVKLADQQPASNRKNAKEQK